MLNGRRHQLDATRGPNVDLGKQNSGGRALTISSLAEHHTSHEHMLQLLFNGRHAASYLHLQLQASLRFQLYQKPQNLTVASDFNNTPSPIALLSCRTDVRLPQVSPSTLVLLRLPPVVSNTSLCAVTNVTFQLTMRALCESLRS